MLARLFDIAAGALVYCLAATFVAELIVAAYVWSVWDLDKERMARALAVARGIEPPVTPVRQAVDEAPPEEVSYEAIADRRARAFRDLELREQAVTSALARLETERRALADERAQQQQWSKQFAAELASLKEGAEAEGRDVVRSTLESLRPSQAKQQIMEMLEAGEMNVVVVLLTGMSTDARAGILAEFKTPDEAERLAEILRQIREGAPEAPLADRAAERLDEAKPILR